MPLNFTLQDTLSLLFATLLFPIVLVFPGYVIGWFLDIFSFSKRTFFTQYVISIALSNALTPIILYLAYRFASNQVGIGIIFMFFTLWAGIQIKLLTTGQLHINITQREKSALIIGGIWVIFCILLLVDIQIGQRLYFNDASFDFTTRTSLIEAITRTGIPPINPTYYPGHFEKITELYYFWYIPGSIVDTIGGKLVDARIALFGGIIWCGLSLMATIAVYLRIRNRQNGTNHWYSSISGIQLLAVSGLDFVPVIAIMVAIKTTFGILPFDGRIESWNMPIMSWLNALTWVPNHVASMSACMIAMLTIVASFRENKLYKPVYLAVAGASIGSALGLSTWVAFTFGIFMATWTFASLFKKEQHTMVIAILTAGILGLLLSSQFLIEILQSGGKSGITGAFPLGLYVRHFSFSRALNPGIREIVGILLLPLNYFFELGFFFVIAILWVIKRQKEKNWQSNQFFIPEFLLLVTVTIILSFVKSTVIAINDLGIRGWLLGQFILIVWAVDILNAPASKGFLYFRSVWSRSKKINDLIIILLIVGLMTTALEASSTRLWAILVDMGVTGVPNELTPDTNLGERTYAGRLAYEFIRDHTPDNLIVQNNPTVFLDRPSGLYGTRQMAIADRTAYGVPADAFKQMTTSIGQIFLNSKTQSWDPIDRACRQYFIQAIIVNDTDPLWLNMPVLKKQRNPIYINSHYAVFSCGN